MTRRSRESRRHLIDRIRIDGLSFVEFDSILGLGGSRQLHHGSTANVGHPSIFYPAIFTKIERWNLPLGQLPQVPSRHMCSTCIKSLSLLGMVGIAPFMIGGFHCCHQQAQLAWTKGGHAAHLDGKLPLHSFHRPPPTRTKFAASTHTDRLSGPLFTPDDQGFWLIPTRCWRRSPLLRR
jgi:hypothetical protein